MGVLEATPTRRAAGFLAAFVLLLAPACGGDESAAGPGAERFASAYRDVTADYREESNDIRDQGQAAAGQGIDRLIELYESVLRATEDAQQGYATLEPPSQFEPTLDRMVELLADQTQALRELIDSARANQLSSVAEAAQNLTDLQAEWNDARQEMEQLFDECGEPCSA